MPRQRELKPDELNRLGEPRIVPTTIEQGNFYVSFDGVVNGYLHDDGTVWTTTCDNDNNWNGYFYVMDLMIRFVAENYTEE